MARALAEQAERVAARVRDGLSEPPGAAGHDEPWLQSGALRDSVGAQADGLQAAVGSSDPAAVPQEMGTAHMPPRLFLAPVAAGGGGGGRPGRGRGRSSRLEGRAGRRRRYPCRRVVKRPNPQRSIQSVRRFPARLARERGLDAQHDTASPGTRPRFSFGAGGMGRARTKAVRRKREPIRSSRRSSPAMRTTRDAELITGTRTLNRRILKRCTKTRNETPSRKDELGMGRMPMVNGINTTRTTREALITPAPSEIKMSQSQFTEGASKWR